jgi:hypothetical protein
VRSWTETLPPVPEGAGAGGWKAQYLYQGATDCLAAFDCHVSVLDPGRCPLLSAPVGRKLLALIPGSLTRRVPHPWRRAVKRSFGLRS